MKKALLYFIYCITIFGQAQKANSQKPLYNHDLSTFITEEISPELIEDAYLLKKKNKFRLLFSMTKSGKTESIRTNVKNHNLNKAIINAFQKYPIEKLNLPPYKILTVYIINGTIDIVNSKKVINFNDKVIIESTPIYKGCQKSKNFVDLKKCSQKKIATVIRNGINLEELKKTDLKGKIKLLCSFKVGTDNSITDIEVKAPSPILEAEIERVLKNIPPFYRGGFQNGKAVSAPYKIPITYYVK
ncbi:hypothetical protein VOI54_06170 [Tamlana sp. 2201CG12-4]|uniref:hypothetical protein n=1 Tax=Tamlana sp. 2201CG12-4 TaxID=3112582 RepID=UPI002DB89175|nr:hypothetical protein [Tamlana sp. 2201CG12-4]MEC3906596.1 hypothetical protein [Tamlana sp. 2201CG12-4]